MDDQTVAIVEAAKQATVAGIAVVPVREDGSKRPDIPTWQQYQRRLPTRDELRGWFGEYQRTGLGWITGAVSGGLECIDFDTRDAINDYAELMEVVLPDIWDRLIAYKETTPKGAHIFYRCELVEGNKKLARADDGTVRIETRGEGGFVVVAPSYGAVHPSGDPYLSAGNISDIPTLTVEEREQVLAVARSLDRYRTDTADATDARIGTVQADGTRPGDIFNGRATWSDVLERGGWRRVHQRAGEEYWRRPGARTDGIDATTNYADSGLLYVFSTSAAPFEPERGYSKFGAYALLYHGGDYQAAARDLVAQGYADEVDPAERLVATKKPEPERKPDGIRSASYRFAHGWPSGHFVTRYIEHASGRTDAAHEYHEAAALALLAAATPNVRTNLSAWPDGLATNLYFLLLGGTTSSRKSTSLGLARRMMRQVDASAILAERMTPEAMIEQLAGRPRVGSLLVGDEFGEALTAILKTDGYMAAMRELLLRLYDERHYKYVRRSKRDRSGTMQSDYDEVNDQQLVVLTASTGAIFETLSNRDVQTGLVPRFAIIYPTAMPPRRSVFDAPGGGSDEALVDYLGDLYRWSSGSMAPEVVWSDEAMPILDELSTGIEQGTNEITQRLSTMALKVAMLSALGDGVPRVRRVVIEERDALQAQRVIKRWEDAALRFADEIGGLSAEQRRTEQTIERVRRMLRDRAGTITRSDAGRALKMSARTLDELEATMADRGIIRVMQQEPDGRGRPAKVWGLQ